MNDLHQMAHDARLAAWTLAASDIDTRNAALLAMADALEAAQEAVLAANALDLEAAKGHISTVMLDRLALSPSRIAGMAEGIRQVANLPDPVGRIRSRVERPNGLIIDRVGVPMGVVAIIYESRPNVTSDAAALALKSGNACVLRGGKEAWRSANAIVTALRRGISSVGLSADMINLIEDTTRASATELMKADDLVDLLIPRGGAGLIRACVDAEGPAKLTKKLGITGDLNRDSVLTSEALWIEDDGFTCDIQTVKRVGIGYASQEDQDKLWRFKMI